MNNPYFQDDMATIYQGDCREVLREMPAESINCCVTSPPYFGLRDYGVDGQIGLEQTPEEYVAQMVSVFREVWRVLRDDGTVWLNLGDSYGTGASGQNFDPAYGATNSGGQGISGTFGHRKQMPVRGFHKQILGIPWRVAFALQADGWYLRQDIIWAKPNPMPESVTDRCTKSHEYIFLLSKSARYYFDADAVAEPSSGLTGGRFGSGGREVGRLRQDAGRERPPDTGTRNRRSVWTVATSPYSGAHFATFPPKLIEPCILAGCPEGGTVLDPFAGSGTTIQVANSLRRAAVGIELNPQYLTFIEERRRNNQVRMFA